jgi:hypothetical protein
LSCWRGTVDRCSQLVCKRIIRLEVLCHFADELSVPFPHAAMLSAVGG